MGRLEEQESYEQRVVGQAGLAQQVEQAKKRLTIGKNKRDEHQPFVELVPFGYRDTSPESVVHRRLLVPQVLEQIQILVETKKM